MKIAPKLIQLRTGFKSLALAMPFALTGCFPWPSGEDPEPVGLESVATSEIEIHMEGKIIEESDSFQLNVSLRNSDDASLLLDEGSSLDLQTLDVAGVFRSLVIDEEVLTKPGNYFEIIGYDAPSTYRLMLNRSNGEEVELFNILLKAKFRSNSTIEDTTFGNGDIFAFDWGFYDGDNLLDIFPQGGLTYGLKCGDEYFNGYISVERNSGITTSPLFVDIDQIIVKNNPVERPCEAVFSRSYFLYESENTNQILAGEIGSSTFRPRPIGNGSGFYLGVSPKKYEFVIN